ncbi:MAG: PEP-CTERM sorting domain-containing protein [Candidatus Accumulibacter meliphilus]|jgi:hypothetical protein|uniref:PEP-CTERM sorting domain-containing protein n=1 Tax=Candidatus Accumulibacter meliphilus TaxID=2211374 RepID=A0A369XU44_9PROT|nr:MAG: PEP-CTERM sorting domain-containing protein [Candidatus Accumulibacter meliphilus]
MFDNQTQIKKGRSFLFAALAMLASATAGATVVANIPTGTSWQQAIDAGNIVPSQNDAPLTQAAMAFYLTQGVPLQVMAATLLGDVDGVSDPDGNTVDNTLVMGWELPENDNLAIAWWDYRFDPTGNGTVNMGSGSSMIHFSVYPPVGVWDLSLELIDVNGKSRGWFRYGPANLWDTFWISPNGREQDPFDFYWNESLFDITQVLAVRFNESGMRSAPFFPSVGEGIGWNAWNSLQIKVPEPATLALLGLSLAALGATARRRREPAKG